MKDNLTVGFIVLVVLLGTAGIVGVVREEQKDRVVDLPSWRAIEVDPEFYQGRIIRFPSEGCQPGASNRELVFRRRADLPPVVVCSFVAEVKDPPKFICGKVEGQRNGVVYLVDCRACDKVK